MSSLPQALQGMGTIGIGVGSFEGKSAVALGVSKNFMMSNGYNSITVNARVGSVGKTYSVSAGYNF